MEKPLQTLHKSLLANNYDVPEDYDSFEYTLSAPGKEGYDNRFALWKSLRGNNFDVPDNYDDFRDTLFNARPKDNRKNSTSVTSQPQKQNVGGPEYGLDDGVNYTEEVIKRHSSPDNKAPHYKDIAQIASEVESEGIPAYTNKNKNLTKEVSTTTPWIDENGRTLPYTGQVRTTEQPSGASYQTPYRPNLTAAQRDEIERENSFAVEQNKKLIQDFNNEEERRNKPLVDTGNKTVNQSVIKTQGQWDDELQRGISELGNIISPMVSTAMKKADDTWWKIMEQNARRPRFQGMEITDLKQANEATDPDKILQALQTSLKEAYDTPEMKAEIEKRANALGIPKDDYLSAVVAPALQQRLSSEFASSQIASRLPKNATEYIMQGLSNSVMGMLGTTATQTQSQRRYASEAQAMTEEGLNPHYNPGTVARLAQMGVTFAADAPFFGLYGRIGGNVVKRVAEQQIRNLMAKGLSEGAARSLVGTALENSAGARMRQYIMQHVGSSAITMGGFNLTSEGARQMHEGQFDPKQLASSTGEGLLTGAAFGLTGGAAQALTHPLSGITRIGAKVAGYGVEAETLYATEELAKMMHGEEGFTNPFEGSVEALEKLGVMKLSSGHLLESGAKKIARAKEVGAKKAAVETLAGLLAPNRTGVKFTREEQDYIRNSAEGRNLIEALSQMHPEIAVSEVGGKRKLTPEGEQMRQRLSEGYSRFMSNPETPANVKQKVALTLGGLYHPGLETGSDIIHNDDGSVYLKTRDKDGNCIQELKFDSFSDADDWRNEHETEFRLNDAANSWNGTAEGNRRAAVTEIAETLGISWQDAKDMVYKALDKKDSSLDRDQYNMVFDIINRNAYPEDEYNPLRRYQEGKQISPIERHKVKVGAQVAEEAMRLQGDKFADEVIAASDYPDEKIAELVSSAGVTAEQIKAATDYYNAMAKAQGMMDEALKSIDEQVDAENARVRKNTHTGSGSLIEASYRDGQYYITAGHFQITPDGKLMPTDNSGLVILRDKNTGEIVAANPNEVTATAVYDPNRIIAGNDSMEGLRGQLMKQADDSIELHPDTPENPQSGDSFVGIDGQRYAVLEMADNTGNPIWMKVAVDENDNTVGEPQPLDIEEYRKAKSDEMDAAEIPQDETAGAVNDQAERTNINENSLGNDAEEEGSASVDASEADYINVSDGEGGGTDVPPSRTEETASRIPVDEKGKKLYEQAAPEDVLAELSEKYGAEKARQMIAKIAENTARHYEELSNKDTSKITDMDELAAHEDELADTEQKMRFWQDLLPKEEAKTDEQTTEEPVIEPEPAAEPEQKPATPEAPATPAQETETPVIQPEEPVTPPAEPQTPPTEPEQPAGPTAEQKVAQGTVKNNLGKRFGFQNQDGTRSEVVIDAFNGDDMVTVTRQDYYTNGQRKGEPYQQDLKLTDVGNSIVNGFMKPALTTRDKLGKVFKVTVGKIPLIDVLTEAEQQQLLDLYAKNDKEAIGNLTGDLIDAHHEDLILKGRDNRNQKVDQILNSNAGREQKLRQLRQLYHGDIVDSYLSDDALFPASAEEWVSELNSRVPKSGEGPLAYFSYDKDGSTIVGMQDETGFGTKSGGDNKGYAPWLAPKGKGISLQRYGEMLHSQLPENIQDQYSVQDMRNAVRDVFGSAERPSDIPTMVIRRGILQAENAARRMEEQWIEGGPSFHKASADDSSFAGRLERAKQQTNTEPTDAQKEKGNYKKGHVSFGGYDFVVENPEGSMRRGESDGKKWEQKMNNTYGYILGKYGKDGDHLDMFINDAADLDNWNGNVYVVDQVDPKTGKLDEHKILYGFGSLEEARQAYLSNYEEGWQGLGKITGVTKDGFDKWLDSSDKKIKAFADHSIAKEHMVESEDGAKAPQSREQIIRDAVVEHLRSRGIEVSTDWQEGQRVLDEYNGNGQVKKMGSRVDSKKNQLSEELGEREMTEAQKTVANVFTGKSDNQPLTVLRDGKDLTVKMRQGNEQGAGTKHSLFRHYGTDTGVITADDVMRIPDVIADGEKTEKQRGKTRLNVYRLTGEDGTKYTVLTEINNRGKEVFNDFYTNRKASSAARLTVEDSTARLIDKANGHTNTQLSAQADTNNASSGAKVQQNSETANDSAEKFFKTPDGHAYGYTYKGKIYIDPRIATSETPVHEYSHLWAEMKRQTAPEEWNHIKQVMLGDKLVQPIIEKVKREYPELAKEGKEDDFIEEIITQFSGKRGAERLREIANEVAAERGGVFGKAEAITAMQRLKNILNTFWEGVAKMMGWKYRNANQVVDRIMADMLNGVNPRERMKEASSQVKSQQEIERTLMGVHNISEDKLRKVLKQGGFANPSLAVVDTKNHMHTDYGSISLIPKASLIDARTGRNAGTFTADAWTPTYPTVQKRMSDKGQTKFWKDLRDLREEDGDMANLVRMAFDTWLDKDVGQDRLSYWYLKEKGMNPEMIRNKNPYGEDIVKRIDELTNNGKLDVSGLSEEQIKEVADMYHAYKESIGEPVTPAEERIKKLQERMEPDKPSPFLKLQQFRLDELNKYGELLHNLNQFAYSVRRSAGSDGKPNLDATVDKAINEVKDKNLQQDFDKWLQDKADSYGIEEWLYNGTDDRTGKQKWVRNTLKNASRLMKEEGLNGAKGWSSLGSWIATVANKEKTLGGIRKYRKNLATTEEQHDAWREDWGNRLYPVVQKLGRGDVFGGDNVMKDILEHNDYAGYLKREYGMELTKEERNIIDTFINEVRTNFPTGYFETKFERPVMLDEFEIAVVPENTSPDIVEALKNAGLDVRTYDNTGTLEQNDANRTQAAMDAVQGRDDIMFQKKREAERVKTFHDAIDEMFSNPDFDKTAHSRDRYDLGDTPEFMKKVGITGDSFSLSFKNIKTHMGKDADHNLTAKEWHELPEAIKKPFLITTYGDKEGRYRLYTSIKVGNKFAVVGIDVIKTNQGKDKPMLEVNRIKTVFGRDRYVMENGEQILAYDEKMTPEQEALLRGHNFREYPSIQELSGSKDTKNINTLQENEQKNEGGALKFQKVESDTHSDNFKNFFGDWEKEPEKASKVVDKDGEPMVVYHQTGNDFTVFDPRHKGAGTNDYQLPFGIFMKPSARSIGVGGDKQMALYANIRKPLRVANRQELSRLLQSKVEGYKEALAEYEKIDQEYSKKFDEAMKYDHERDVENWNKWKAGEITEEEYQNAISDTAEDVVDQWKEAQSKPIARMKELVDDYFKNSEYDGIWIAQDEGSLGRTTETIIAFEPNQVKSATENNGDYNPENPDIRFQRVSPDSELTPENEQYWKQWDAAMKKWKERNALPMDAQEPTERPRYQTGENAMDYAKRVTQFMRERKIWQTAPKLEDYRQARDDKKFADEAHENEKRYPDSEHAKRWRIATDLARIRHAMSRQKAYDKATVKAVTDFAQDFMKMGFGDNLRRGEMERMLSAVKNATGAKDIKKHVDTIMNILVDNQLRNLDQQIVKLSSIKELRQTAQGVERQGKLELKGQKMIQSFREARESRMTVEEIKERMAGVMENIVKHPDSDDMWEQEYEGLVIALQYAENIDGSRQEFKALDDEYKDAVKSYKESGRSYQAQQQLLESLDKAMLENKMERIGSFGDIIGRLEGNIAVSIEGAKEFLEREKQRVKHIQEMANFDLAGKDMGAQRKDTKGKPANFFLQPLATFEQMLRQFGARNANGEGYLYNYFMRNWMDATDKAYLGEKQAKDELDAKAREVFGDKVKRWSDLYKIVMGLPTMDVEVADQGDKKTFTLTQGNLLYIYMANKMNDGAMKLRKMGIDEETVERIKDFLDPRLVQLGDWLQDEYLPGKRVAYNKVHERMFGAPMAAIDHYFPIKILSDARVQEQDVNVPDSETLPSTITGNIIKRRKNALPLDILNTDALSLAIEHIEDMEHWAAQAEWNRDVNALLSYTTFRNKVKNMKTIYGSGDALWNTFKDAAKMAAGTYNSSAKSGHIDKTISNIAKGVTAAKIAFRVYTAFKQTLSAPAFLHDVDLGKFAKYSVNPYGSWKWAMENMPVFRKRWESRQVGDTRLMDDPTDWKMWKNDVVQWASRWGMSPNALVDGVTCAVGARAIYESRLEKYQKMGVDEETARKRALQDAEIGYNLTQQSSEGAFVSAIQKDRTVAANMLSVFRNSSMAYTRQWVDASRNLKHRMQKDYKEDSIDFMTRQFQDQFGMDEEQARQIAEAEYARAGRHDVARLLNMMFGVTIAWNLGASLPYLLIGDDDDTKEEMLKDALLKGLIAGPSEGFAAGNIVSDMVGLATSESVRDAFAHDGNMAGVKQALKDMGEYDINPLPLFADIEKMIEKLGYDGYASLQDLFNICMQSAVGVNPQTFTDMYNAVMDYAAPGWDGTKYTWNPENMLRAKELALFMMRMINAPTSSWRNKYIDELGMNAEDAKKLSYDEMASRYAHYKHWKDSPFMGWLRGEEGRQEKMEKIRKQFDNAVQERIERLTDEELKHNVARSGSLDERRMIARTMAKRLGITKSVDGKKAKEEWQQNYQRLMTYEDIREDELLYQKKREASERSDKRTLKAINRAIDRITERGKKKLGFGEDQEKMEKIRQWRREALEKALKAEDGTSD